MTTFMAMLCLAGVAFCVRFLVALGEECKARSPSLLAGPALPPNPRQSRNRRNAIIQLIERAWERIGRGPFSDPSDTLGNTNRSEKGYF